MAVADTKVPIFNKDHFWDFMIKKKFEKKSRGKAVSDYRMLISSGFLTILVTMDIPQEAR